MMLNFLFVFLAKVQFMSKKIKTKEPATTLAPKTISKENNILIYLLFAALIILLYGSTINYEFTLDDDLFYLKHKSVQKGFDGVGEIFSLGSLNQFDGTTGTQPYRPATLLFFTFQHVYFDNSPTAAHLLNVFMYVLVSIVLYTLLRKLFSSLNRWYAVLITVLYIVHPIHTEVVSSVKSVDELLAALFCFASLLFFIPKKDQQEVSLATIILGIALFFLGLLSKESSIAFLVIIPLAYYMLINANFKIVLKYFSCLAAATGLFLFMRYKAIGTAPTNIIDPLLDNILYRANGFAEVTATKAQILFYYIKLMFIPWPLSWDYSYNQISVVNWSSLTAWLGLLIYGALFVFAILQIRKMPILSFCILFFFLASSPTNNLFIINGANVGERFLFVPSLSFTIFIIWGAAILFKMDLKNFSGKNKILFLTSIGVFVLIFSVLSKNRSKDWINNLTLFEKGIEVCPNSSRTQYSAATEYLNAAQTATEPNESSSFFNKALAHFNKSIEIYPKNTQAHYNSGICYSKFGDTTNAILHYKKAIEYDRAYVMPMNNLGVIYQKRELYDSAQKYYEMAHNINKQDFIPRKNLGDLYFFKAYAENKKGNIDKSLEWYRISASYNENNPILLNNMAFIYSYKKQNDSALICLKKAISYDPNSLVSYENIAVINFQVKNYTDAIEFANKALTLNSKSQKAFGVLIDVNNALGKTAEAQKYQQVLSQLNK